MENRYAALVRGSSAIFPRGYLWLIPAWYAAIAIAMEIKGQLPGWYCDCALGALLMATFTLVAVLSTLRSNAFLADDSGIWLGLRQGARRRGRRRRQNRLLPWPEIARVRISSRRYGARLEVFLPPGAGPDTIRGRLAWRLCAAVVTLLIPLAYLFRMPGILRPMSGRRYRIPLYDVTAEQLHMALAPMVPPHVAVTVIPRWRTRAMRRLRRSQVATAA